MRIRLLLCSCLTLAIATPSLAQDSSKYYTVQHPKEFDIDWGSFYRDGERRTAEVRSELPHYLDLPYGSDPKQRLDLYLPRGKLTKAPVFLFFHGGGFREGDRAQYGYIAAPFAKHGVITAVASYRLTSQGFKYPDQPDDARNAFAWLYRNVARYGGDPQSLYVGGHSAGAILAADLGGNTSWLALMGIPVHALKGIAPVSGPYDLRVAGRPGEGSAYAPTADLQTRASPLLNLNDPAPISIIALGSTETRFTESSNALAKALNGRGTKAAVLVLDGENHADTARSLGNENSELFRAVLGMIQPKPK